MLSGEGVWYDWAMTDTHELIAEIETFLELTAKREIFTSTEIQDLLLDLRGLLSEQAFGSTTTL